MAALPFCACARLNCFVCSYWNDSPANAKAGEDGEGASSTKVKEPLVTIPIVQPGYNHAAARPAASGSRNRLDRSPE